MKPSEKLRHLPSVVAGCLTLLLVAGGMSGAAAKRGPRGPQGPQGATGAQGPQGPAGASAPLPLSYYRQTFTSTRLARSEGQRGCAGADEVVLGGGVAASGGFEQQWINGSTIGPDGWLGGVDNVQGTEGAFEVTAICTVGAEGKVRMGSRGARDKRGPRGPAGPRGATGPRGSEGPAGPDAVSLRYLSEIFTAPPQAQASGTVSCPPGEHVTGGGVLNGGALKEQWINGSTAAGTTRWKVFVDNFADRELPFTVYAVCLRSRTTNEPDAAPSRVADGERVAKHRRHHHRGRRGPRGPRGPQGATGPAGATGPEGVAPPVVIHTVVKNVAVDPGPNQIGQPGAKVFGEANCPAGEHVTGGGVRVGGSYRQEEVASSFPGPGGDSWQGFIDAVSGNPQTAQVIALCLESDAVEGTG